MQQAIRRFFAQHRRTRLALLAMAAFFGALLLAAALVDWNLLRGPVAKVIAAKTGRPASIDGDLRVRLWSWTPTADINGLRLGNPRWAKEPVMFSADRLLVTVSLGRLLRGQVVMPRLEVFRPRLNLERDTEDRANWRFSRAGKPPARSADATRIPAIRRLLIRDGTVELEDRLKKLTLSGTLTAGEGGGKAGSSALELRLKGLLNSRPLRVDFSGGPLVALSPDTPYDFDASIVASTIRATAAVSIVRPFDLSEFTARLRLTGNDLADAYYLTSVTLPNTAKYDISGKVHRTDALFRIDDLSGRIGSSDINGSVRIDTRTSRFALKADLTSNNLDLRDLAPTLGSAGESDSDLPPAEAGAGTPVTAAARPALLLPDADLQVQRVRAMDAEVNYRAQSVTARKLPLKLVNFHLLLKDGVLTLEPLSFRMAQGAVAGTVRIDARPATPQTHIDMRVEQVDLSQFRGAEAADAPMSGDLQGRLQVQGTGASVHKVASTADGRLGIAIPHGEIRDVLAELTGINVLKGLGLLFTGNDQKVDIRCGVLNFVATDGTLKADSFFIDTTNVLITGGGEVHLDSEELDLTLQGAPKHLRLVRMRAPVTLGGTLSDPVIGVDPEKLAVQTGAAVALSSLLSPVAAVLAFVDPGLAEDKNCAATLAQSAASNNATR